MIDEAIEQEKCKCKSMPTPSALSASNLREKRAADCGKGRKRARKCGNGEEITRHMVQTQREEEMGGGRWKMETKVEFALLLSTVPASLTTTACRRVTKTAIER